MRFRLVFAVPFVKLDLNLVFHLLTMFSNDSSVFFLFQSEVRQHVSFSYCIQLTNCENEAMASRTVA
jgi:hypothetical protein